MERVHSDPQRGRLRLLPAVLSGGYAWVMTVAPAALSASAPAAAWIAATVALLALLAAPFLPRRRWALLMGLDVFVAASCVVWVLTRDLERLPFLAFMGSLGWVAFTLAWGSLSSHSAADALLVPGRRFAPRAKPSWQAASLILVVVAAVLFVIAWAWTVPRNETLVLAHVLGLSVALLLLRGGAQAASLQQIGGPQCRSAELRRVWRSVLVLGLLLVLGGLAFWRA